MPCRSWIASSRWPCRVSMSAGADSSGISGSYTCS